MNSDQLEGKWKQYSGKLKEKWGKLTDDDLEAIRGRRDQLAGKIQERYGIAREAAQQQVDEFSRAFSQPDVNYATDERDEDVNATSRSKARGAGRS